MNDNYAFLDDYALLKAIALAVEADTGRRTMEPTRPIGTFDGMIKLKTPSASLDDNISELLRQSLPTHSLK